MNLTLVKISKYQCYTTHGGVRQNSQNVKKGYTFVNQQKIQQV